MTTPVSGSSLPQTRDVHQHNHFHHSRESHHHHYHHHTHHARSQNSNKRGHKRTDSEPTIIIETVSVLELIDSAGAPITFQTLTPSTSASPSISISISTSTSSTSTSSTSSSSSYISSSEPDATVDPSTTTTTSTTSSVSVPVSAPALPTTTSTPGASDDEGNSLSSSTSVPTIDPTVAPSESSMPTTFPTLSYSPLTSTPLSGSPVFPSLAGVTNTTQSSSSTLSHNSTSSTSQLPFTVEGFNSSVSGSSGTTFSSDSSFTSSTPTSTTRSSPSSTTFTHWGVPSQTDGGDDGVGNAQPSSSSAVETGDDSSSNGPDSATVAGSVLGGVAALAGILILALFLLKWKKRQNTRRLMRGSMSDRGPGGGLVGNSGPGGGDGGMSEKRRSIPFAIPAALANLTGHKRFSGRSAASADGGERGFSKVSGRKLPPVIQFGGDGYSDPRDTILSDQSVDYRDSTFPGLGGGLAPTRLAVGAPMRPESGVPVFNPGPARTPKTEQAPFSRVSGNNSPLAPPPRDPLGRSHPSHDGSSRSHGSASRFTEEL
ncbi:hypothetical protein F4811DRAFT_222893 [Daldinia bambusicola]|nr:hypothetical protein F4811DRAFT_222893 [Daldinia bambusicola]